MDVMTRYALSTLNPNDHCYECRRHRFEYVQMALWAFEDGVVRGGWGSCEAGSAHATWSQDLVHASTSTKRSWR